MTSPVPDGMETLRKRLGAVIDQAAAGDETRGIAAEALEELSVAIEEIQAQNIELSAGRQLLEAERERYRMLFHTVPDGFLITTTDGMIVEANQTAANLLGRQLSTLIGRPLAKFVASDDRRAYYAHLSLLSRSEAGAHITLNLALDDHVLFAANLRATVVRTSTDTGMEIRWLVHDRRNEIETEELRASEEQLRALFETAQVGILLCDAGGWISFSNRHADDLLGRRHGEFGLDEWMSTVHADDRAAVEEMVVSVGRGGVARSLRYRIDMGRG